MPSEQPAHEDRGQGDERGSLDGRVSAEIRQGAVRFARRLSAERPVEGLSLNKCSILGHLRRNGPMSAGALAAADRQQPQSLTRVFAELQRDGLISRTRDTRDGRQQVLAITQAGDEALDRDMAQRDAWLDIALADLNETERQVLLLAARLMDRLADSPAVLSGG
ncbi:MULTISPECIES: MarR family transcriptional regulator [unclassified Streptomyces]|uniref:MarR family winged helix-turn-helix transcriptional regulator n=1 Tax=unclassified Streptomyces TaxID=2593676 RepID=UPI003405F7B7